MSFRSMLVAVPLTLCAAFAGCGVQIDDPELEQSEVSEAERREPIGKADKWGSCKTKGPEKNFCGAKGGGNCYCDKSCADFGDCCADYVATCGKVECTGIVCAIYCPYGHATDQNGCPTCSCAPAPTPKASCANKCGGVAADKACYCDAACKKYDDCCTDYDKQCGETRTPASGWCVKNSGDACTTDADCTSGGCGGELCYNPGKGGGISTCECTQPTNVAGCGCVAGKCSWYN